MGPSGLELLASDVEKGFGRGGKPRVILGILGILRGMTFQVGADYKKDAQAFLAGLAAGTKNQELEEASYHLRTTANCYEQGLAEIDQILQKKPASEDMLARVSRRIADLLRRAAKSERNAGNSLRRAAKAAGSL